MNEHQSHPGQFLARFDRVQTVCTGGISAAWSLVCTRSFVASAVFFPWYIWALAYYPELVLWWTAASAGILLVAVSSIWPRSFLYWLPPVLLWFNTAYHWLPWPYVKMAYVGPAALCLGVVIGAGRTGSRERVFSLDFILFFTCLLVAAGLGIASQFDFTREAAWHELGEQLRTVPLLDERMQYVPLRYAWAWCLGLALFAAVTRLLRGERDIRTLLWSFQWATLPATLFGIYSYHTRLYMVSYYVYERRINATFSSPAVLADLFTALFIAGFHLLRRAHSWPARICLVVLMAGQLLSIIYSGCRVNLLILCIVAAGWGVYRLVTLRRVRYLVYSAVFAAALAGVCAGGWTLMPPGVKARITASSAMTRAVRYASTVPAVQRVREWRRSLAAGASIRQTFLGGRWEHWSCAARMFKSSPLWGIGCGLFEQQYEHFRVSADVFQYARAHNVFLRVMAEGGMVTLAACAVFFVLAFWRLARSLSRSCAWESPVWAACTRGFLAVFAGIAISSMASDVLFENAETIMVFSVLAACAACSYRQLAATADMSSQLAVRLTGQVKRAVYFAELKLNWVELGVAPLWVFVKGIPVILIIVCIVAGMVAARKQCRERMGQGSLSYGFYYRMPGSKSQTGWGAISKSAMTGVIVKQPTLCFRYRAFNSRMARMGQRLHIALNGYHAATVAVDTTSERSVYCDVSGMVGKWMSIELETDKAFVPWKEHWFADSHAYGSLLSGPVWIKEFPTNLIARFDGVWNVKWSADPEWYGRNGYTNVIQ